MQVLNLDQAESIVGGLDVDVALNSPNDSNTVTAPDSSLAGVGNAFTYVNLINGVSIDNIDTPFD